MDLDPTAPRIPFDRPEIALAELGAAPEPRIEASRERVVMRRGARVERWPLDKGFDALRLGDVAAALRNVRYRGASIDESARFVVEFALD